MISFGYLGNLPTYSDALLGEVVVGWVVIELVLDIKCVRPECEVRNSFSGNSFEADDQVSPG